MGWTLWLWACVACSGLFLACGQTSGCCTQCKSGYAMVKNVRTRLVCNIPSEPIKPGKPDCTDSCVNGPLNEYCFSCNDNHEENRNDCLTPCTRCSAGKIGTGLPDSVCVTCQPGYRVDGLVCTACPAGQYQDAAHQTSCKSCQPGKYSARAGQDRCYDIGTCPPGEYATHVGSATSYAECAQCVEGKITTSYSLATVCSWCPSGTFQQNKGQAYCNTHVPCVAGQKTLSVGTSTAPFRCEACPQYFTTTLGTESNCDKCVAGRYMGGKVVGGNVVPDCIECPRCSIGQYINCPVGTTLASTSKCMDCSGTQAGSYCPVGQEEAGCDGTQRENLICKDCKAGYHKPARETKNCVKCPTGTYKASPGKANCGACTNGPTNSYYDQWTLGQDATSNGCPW